MYIMVLASDSIPDQYYGTTQYFLFYCHVVTLVSKATVRVIGCCCKSAVLDPQPALLGTTVPPRWNTGT